MYNIRIRETEANACLAELAQKMAELEIQVRLTNRVQASDNIDQ